MPADTPSVRSATSPPSAFPSQAWERARATRGARDAQVASSASLFQRAAVLGLCFTLAAALATQAGDILRGGASAGSRIPTAPPNAAADAMTETARTNAQDALARTTQALQAMKTMQDAARAAADRGPNSLGANPNNPGRPLLNVPNGLAPGGLQVAPGVPKDLANPAAGEDPKLWQGAKLPAEFKQAGRTLVTVEQLKQQALLTWETFNIGKDTTLSFNQSRGGAEKSTWVAFNKINDPSGAPSQILGAIEAPGQVYVLNRNGIIFGGSSQVNSHSLVASSLPLNDNLVTRGLLNNPDFQFLFSALPIPALANGATTPAFNPPAKPTPDFRYGDVTVQPGAELTAPTTPDKVGGRIALVAPNVRNEGTISTPDGQTILAAGLQVGFTPHSSNDPSLRGLDVFVGKVVEPPAGNPSVPKVEYAGTATNAGLIDAPRASVTIAGKTVNQLGVIDSTTSVSVNGRIDLLATYDTSVAIVLSKARFSPGASGLVNIGADSVMRILPERDSDETSVGLQLPIASQLNVQGKAIHLGAGSQILAPNANVTLSAGTWLPLNGERVFTFSEGQIYLEPGATINVAGSIDVTVPIAQNILSLQLRGAELADSPIQRGGLLRGLTLDVDIRNSGVFDGTPWVGTPLGDVSGFVGLIRRTAGELTTAGGTVKLNAGNSVILQPGSTIDVAGGWTSFQGGLVKTTRVMSGGFIFDLANATPDRIYDGIYDGTFTQTSAKWGVSETFSHPLALDAPHFEQSYTQGGNGGAISITAPSVALDGELRGQTVAGPHQRVSGPAPSALNLTFQAQDSADPVYATHSPTPPTIAFRTGVNLPPASPFGLDDAGNPRPLRNERQAEVVLPPDFLTAQGFGTLKIDNSDGDIVVPPGVKVTAPPGGSITLAGANIDIQGEVTAPGGKLDFTAYNISPTTFNKLKATQNAKTPPVADDRGLFTLGAAGTLSTAGLIVDDRPGAITPPDQPLFLDGGEISIKSYRAELARGGTIDVSGGVQLSGEGEVTYGDAGSIAIIAGADPNVASVFGGRLVLGSTLKGFSGSQAGALAIQAPFIQIGGAGVHGDALLLAPEFFSQGGFGSFDLTGLGAPARQPGEMLPAIVIGAGPVLNPIAQSWLAEPNGPGGAGLTLTPMVKPEGMRDPVSLTFHAPGVKDTFTGTQIVRGEFEMRDGASIKTDALGSVTIAANTATVLGSIVAPGGTISISGGKDSTALYATQDQALTTVYLGPHSILSTAGTTVLTANPFGYRTGYVFPGGSISVSGNIVVAAGAMLDVSGTTEFLDLPPAVASLSGAVNGLVNGAPIVPFASGLTSPLWSLEVVRTAVDTDGGSITLTGGQQLFTDATLLGAAGGPTALGGTLSVSSGRFYAPNGGLTPTPLDVTLTVTQYGPTLPSSGKFGVGFAVPSKDAQGYFAANRFALGGFDSLTLGGTVEFAGPVSINTRRDLIVADGGVIFADAAVALTAPHVKLGLPFVPPLDPSQVQPPFQSGGAPFRFPPTFGAGRLTVTGRLIEIGNLSLQHIGSARFIADDGDIRGDGTLDVSGDIYLRAGQVYPPTGVKFTIAASDRNVLVAASTLGNPIVTLASATLPPGFGVGSPLLGSTVQSIQGATVTLAAGANALISSNTAVVFAPGSGSVTFAASGVRQAPLSAGGTLSVYGSNIRQDGVLRAPIGTINLGWDGTGGAPIDPITGASFAVTQNLTLGGGSLTSVAAIDADGDPLLIPYGLNLNGVSWIDPTGRDITAGGVPEKAITIAGTTINDRAGAIIDIRGGGDLYAYRWVKGNGGTQDVLRSTASFAVIPGYAADFAPYAPFNPNPPVNASNPNQTTLGGDPGYVNGQLDVGDRIYLNAGSGLAAGVYTLLPARYALLEGAFLVTPKSGDPRMSITLNDGATLVPGYRFNDLNTVRTVPTVAAQFEIAPGLTVRLRSEYADYFGNNFLTQGALDNEVPVPRLPTDAGHLVFQATQQITLLGNVLAQGAGWGRGGFIDIATLGDMVIGGPGTTAAAGVTVLDSKRLSSFGAESLLIGGVRTFGTNGTTVSVKTSNLTVDNAGTSFRAPEIILASRKNLTLEEGANVTQSGRMTGRSDDLLIGNAAAPGSGDGVLLRVSDDPGGEVVRTGVTASLAPNLVIKAGASVSGRALLLDSTAGTTLDPNAHLDGDFIALNSGRISIVLDNSVPLQPNPGLVLAGDALRGLQSALSLSLLSYSTMDIYGTGEFAAGGGLALHAAEIRGFNNGGSATFRAGNLTLDNRAGGTGAGPQPGLKGTLAFDAATIHIGRNQLAIDQYATLELNASGGIRFEGNGGLTAQGDLVATTPVITAARVATQSLIAIGDLSLLAPVGSTPSAVNGGIGASLTLQGASLTANSRISLPSGLLTLHATTGDLTVGGTVDLAGTAQTFYDLTKYTSGGKVSLVADLGSVHLTAASTISVAAQPGGGDAGTLSIRTPQGGFILAGTLEGKGGLGGKNGTFELDVKNLPLLSALSPTLAAASFSEAQNIRVRVGDVTIDGTATAHDFRLSADQGGITVSGKIDASGATGGTIALQAGGGVTLLANSVLNAAGDDFSNAGKGGAISLETRGNGGAVIDIQAGARLDLSVASNTAASAGAGHFTGTLHLRAPQLAGNTDLQVDQIDGTITGASSITVEGFKIYDLTGSGLISAAVQAAVFANGTTFGGNSAAISNRLLVGNAGLAPVVSIQTGAEIINTTGNLTLGTANSTTSSDWNLGGFRFGPQNAPGVLTLRASGNLVFLNTLSDGFTTSEYTSPLLAQSATLPVNAQSWSYRLVAGADFGAADFQRVVPFATLAANSGSLLLGKNAGTASAFAPGPNAQTSAVIGNRYQVIRTGSGDIDIAAAADVRLLNQFATIYTAGTQVADPTLGGTFDVPILDASGGQTVLGAVQQNPGYPAQFSVAGGNVTINAQKDITHLTLNNQNQLVADSSRELPINWLYRRGFVNGATGQFGVANYGDVASTAWWVDFSNFFEGIGALGGGNVTLLAGRDVSSVDGLVATNARMPKGAPDASKLLELGGGDLVVRAGRDLDGGVFYIERGHGTLRAGNTIHTNRTRSPSLTNLTVPNEVFAPETWLPTTLFVGKGSFEVSARGDLLLGPVANPFLLPGGYNNTFWYKTYFSTYAPTNAVEVSSLAGAVTLRTGATLPTAGAGAATPLLQAWLQRELLLTSNPQSASLYQPWLRLNESSVTPFGTLAGIMPATLRLTAFAGDINLVGDITLSPAPRGTLEIAAAGAINGLQPNGRAFVNNVSTTVWGTSTINVSDANPLSIPGVGSPLAFQTFAGTAAGTARVTGLEFLKQVDALFQESGATSGTQAALETKQALHAPGPLHADDPQPLRLYSANGNVAGITLFSPKAAQVFAGHDLTDVALYVQNTSGEDVSIVSAGRDIVLYNANAPLRVAARAAGNAVNFDSSTLAGDLQISGPGALEVLAGRDLDLGVGPNVGDGTGLGIVSIGNARNPSLPFQGAGIIAGAGLGPAFGLGASGLDFQSFISEFVVGNERYADDVDKLVAESGVKGAKDFESLPPELQNRIALEIFYLVLRDAGRDFSDPTSSGFNNYDVGFKAIDLLFPKSDAKGDISLTSREIKTQSGGNISLLAPNGKLTVGFDAAGNQPLDQGILTEAGGNISIFTDGDVNLGTSRIFTLRGGNEIIWSSNGSIAAGASSKTVQSAPPTRVILDPQSADVKTDLAGLATGGGIGVLATVKGVPPGDVDLIAPRGSVDAGDAGIRVTGNLNIAAVQVLNADNIQVGGTSTGTPVTPLVAAPNLAGLASVGNTTAAATTAAEEAARQARTQAAPADEVPSLILVEVPDYDPGDETTE
jgi:filamentous hemagglutinin family protein